jgi:hypothetical protein
VVRLVIVLIALIVVSSGSVAYRAHRVIALIVVSS